MKKILVIKKEALFVAATLLLILISYRFSFKNTLEAWQENQKLKSKIIQYTDISIQPGYIERKNKNLDNIINHFKADTTELRSTNINTISSIAERNNAKLIQLPSTEDIYHFEGFIVEKVTFEGDFFSLLKTAAILHSIPNIGVTRSENWKTINISNGGDQSKKLLLTLYLEVAK